jgi:hypothetical protein
MSESDERVIYHVADLVSGQVLDTLPLSGEVSKQIGEVGSQSWSIPIADPRTPPDFHELLQPVRTMIVAEWRGRLVQGWIVVGLKFGGREIEISAATLDRVTEKVHVRTGEWYSVDEAQIAAEICSQVLVPEGGWTVEYTTTGTLTDAYFSTDGAETLRSALEKLGATETGPRWIADVRWIPGDEGARVQKILRIARELGSVRPEARFSGQMIDTYSRNHDWSGDFAALRVWGATEGSTGTGVVGPYSSTKLSSGWHPWESFVSFTDLDDPQLTRRAQAALTERENGAVIWEATCRVDDAPQLLDDWTIGDTVTIAVEPNEYDPIGGELTAQVEGWTLSDEARTITPLLRQEAGES